MSPRAALASNVFCFYTILVLVLLLAAGAALAVLRWGLHKDVTHAWRSYRGWLILVPLAFGSVFLGRTVTIVFFTLAALVGFKEFARATGLYRDWPMTGAVYLGIAATGICSWVRDPTEGTTGWYGFFMALPVYVISAILIIPIVRNRAQGQLQMLALAIVGFLYFGWMFGHLAFLTNAQHAYSYILYLLVAVELNDVAAFMFGRLFGRHKLRSNISPNKTWEGAFGAFAFSMIFPWLVRFTFPDFQVRDCLLAGLIVGVGGQLGDLAISVIKRDLTIKDMGVMIPGHGGVLDRTDSLIYVVPLFFHMVRYFHGLD